MHTLLFSFNNITGTIPSSFSKLRRLVNIESLVAKKRIPLTGGCWPDAFDPPECRISEQSMFSCDCDAPARCGACPCYNYTGADICANSLHRCRRGCTCVPTANWYTCACPAGVDPVPPEYHCKRNNECELYGCGDHVASCFEAGPNERQCKCPKDLKPLGPTLLVSDEEFMGCEGSEECERIGCYLPVPDVLTSGQKAGISIGVLVALAALGGFCVMVGLGRCAWNSRQSYLNFEEANAFVVQ